MTAPFGSTTTPARARVRLTRAARVALGPLLLAAAACRGTPEAKAEAQDTAQGTPTASAVGRVPDWKAVDAAMGRTGTEQPGNVRRYGMPRSDLRVTVQGVAIRPSFALGSWIAMTPHGDGVMAMGDLVLLEDELSPVIDALQAGGVEQSAIHHHLVREQPRILYTHVHAMGDPVKIAQTVRTALARTGTPPPDAGNAPARTGQGDAAGAGRPSVGGGAAGAPLGIDTAAITRALGHAGKVNGGVYQVSIPRAETIREGDVVVPASMGLATAINFQPTGGGKAAITGDFVMLDSEVNPVIRALRAHGIELVSLHHHTLGETPRLLFGHFWANDDAVKLAQGLRAALDETNSRAPATR